MSRMHQAQSALVTRENGRPGINPAGGEESVTQKAGGVAAKVMVMCGRPEVDGWTLLTRHGLKAADLHPPGTCPCVLLCSGPPTCSPQQCGGEPRKTADR